MAAMHLVVRPVNEVGPHPAVQRLTELFATTPEAHNTLATVSRDQVPALLLDVGLTAVDLMGPSARRRSVVLPTPHEAWELGFEPLVEEVYVSLLRTGPIAEVAVFRTPIAKRDLCRITREALAALKAPDLSLEESMARTHLVRLLGTTPPQPSPNGANHKVSIAVSSGALTLEAEQNAQHSDEAPPDGESQLERADLLSLLGRGTVQFQVNGRKARFEGSQVFLDAERLLALAGDATRAWRGMTATFRRAQLTAGRVAIRKGPGEVPFEVRVNAGPLGDASALVVRLEPSLVVGLICRFCIELSEQILATRPSQRHNLRLTSLLREARYWLDQCDSAEQEESLPNPHPDSYRRFVPRLRRAQGAWDAGGKMRFAPRWVATVPQIDLSSTFLCGDLLMVGGQETACLDRRTGNILWKRPLRPAASVVTPSGLVRIEPDGLLSCHHLATGDVRFTQRVLPRAAGAASGTVLHGPGLPRLLALVEGDRQVSGIDLLTGEVRWRYTHRRPGAYRLRRSGRLVLVAGGDPLLVALDGATGEVVWRLRTRLPFAADIAVDRDSAYAFSGGTGSGWHLHHLDPWTGAQRWCVELDERPTPGRAPLIAPGMVLVPTVDHKGAGLLAFERDSGKLRWEHAPGLCARTTAWLAVDDCLVANSAGGLLSGIEATTGHLRYNHVFASAPDADQPRRLEPVLRNGALFVPQSEVSVLRPRDGELLGTLPSDLVPDLIRVDEHCHVYVAEESGHVAAFGAAPRLALIS